MFSVTKIKKFPKIAFQYMAATLLLFSYITVPVQALSSSELRNQSSGLQGQIEANNAKAKALAAEASSLRRTIDNLDIQIDSQTKQIQIVELKIAELEDALQKANAELERQKTLLKASLRALYQKQGASTVELIVASDSFSDFINDQEYLSRLQNSIKDSADKVILLKQQIEAQKNEQEDLRKQRQAELDNLESTKSDRANLLTQTEGQETEYRNLVNDLTAQQAEVNRQLFLAIQLESGNGTNGGYPYNNWPFSMDTPGCPAGDGPDRWGYCTRQCVSYAAWAVERSGNKAPMYWGNAKNWKWHGENDGKRVDRSPEAGAVAVYTSGSFGHVQFVESVNGNGTMRISQYNAQLTGKYSEATVPSSRYDLWFVHF